MSPDLQEQTEQHLQKRFLLLQPSAFTIKCSQDAEKMGSRCPASIPPGMDLGNGVGHSVWWILRYLSSGSASRHVKVQDTSSKESERDLVGPTAGAQTSKPENVLRVHLDRKLGPVSESQIPVDVHGSGLVASHVLDLPGLSTAHRDAGNPASAKGWKTCLNTSHKFSILSPRSPQLPETHIRRV